MQTSLENLDLLDQIIKELDRDHCDLSVDHMQVLNIGVTKHKFTGCVSQCLSDSNAWYRSVLSGDLCHTGSHTEE